MPPHLRPCRPGNPEGQELAISPMVGPLKKVPRFHRHCLRNLTKKVGAQVDDRPEVNYT